jgi:hypothetical protein
MPAEQCTVDANIDAEIPRRLPFGTSPRHAPDSDAIKCLESEWIFEEAPALPIVQFDA